MLLLSGVLAALAVAAPAAAAASSLIAIYIGGLGHWDANGTHLSGRRLPRGPKNVILERHRHVTTDPRTGTVCWVNPDHNRVYVGTYNSTGEERYPGVVVCTPLANLFQTWDLPMPRWLTVTELKALAFDWVGESWHLTASDEWSRTQRSYVCSYHFDQCLRLSETIVETWSAKSFAAYDIPNRLLFRITFRDGGQYRLESVRLDGSGVRVLPAKIDVPSGLAVDPVSRHVYWTVKLGGQITSLFRVDYDGGQITSLFRVDYDGGRRKRVQFPSNERRTVAINVDGAVVVWGHGQLLSAITVDTGEGTALVAGSVNRETVRELANDRNLLAVKVFSPKTQLDAENRCSDGYCQDFCIPVVVNGTAEASCFCQEGYQVAELECRKQHPTYAVVVGADSLQVVDLQTEEMSTILSNLTDGTKVDFFRMGGEEFLLFWLDAGSLFRGHWSPGGTVSDVQLLVQATDSMSVLEVAVDWHQRNLLWLKKESLHSSYGNAIIAEMSPLNGAYVGTIFAGSWKEQNQDLVVHQSGYFSVFVEHGDPHWRKHLGSMRGGSLTCYPYAATGGDLAEVVIDTSMAYEENAGLDRVVWIDRNKQAIGNSYQSVVFSSTARPKYIGYSARHGLLRHPSLADAGGLDVLDGRLFWTERATGHLWTASSQTGGQDVRVLREATGGRAVRLLHPRRQPPAPGQVCDETGSGCSHFCVRGLDEWRRVAVAQCACPNGMELGNDDKTCLPAGTRWDRSQWLEKWLSTPTTTQTMSCADVRA